MTAHIPFSEEHTARLLSMFAGRTAGLHVNAREALPFGAARTDAWLLHRQNTIGASEIAAVMGVSSAPVSPFTLWWRKRLGGEIETTEAMHIGLLLEDAIGGLFAERREDVYLARPRGALYVHPTLDFMTCSPDFLAVVRTATGDPFVVPVECKSDEGGDWGANGTDQVPTHHRMQALWQAAILGAPFAFVAHMARKRFRWFVIDASDAVRPEVNAWIARARSFLDSVKVGDPPEPDAHPSTEDTLKTIYADMAPDVTSTVDDATAAEYLAAVANMRRAKEQYRAAVNRQRAAMGTAGFAAAPSYGMFVRREVFKRDAYAVGPSTVDRLMPTNGGIDG